MKIIDKSFTNDELDILHSLKGQTLNRIDAVIVARDNMSWQTVRLHFNNMTIDINNRLGNIEVDEFGTLEEFGLLSISESSDDVLRIDEVSSDTTVCVCDMPIRGVSVASNDITVYGNGLPVIVLTYPQAIIFEHDKGFFVFDKECWFSEMIAIKQGPNVESLIYDESVDWEDNPIEDPTTHYEFRTAVTEI